MPAAPMFSDRSAATRRRRLRRSRTALGLAVLALALLWWGQANPGSSLVVHDVLGHPILLGVIAYALAVVGIAGHLEDLQHRIVAAAMLAGVGATCFALAGLVISAQLSRERTVVALPAPGPSPLEVVLEDNGDDEQPVARVVVQDRSWSLHAHRYEAACVHAEEGRPELVSAEWQSASALRLGFADGRTQVLALDPDGAPVAPLRTGVLCRRG